MSLRSVDMQIQVHKVSEVNRNQPVQNQQDQTQHQQFSAHFEKQNTLQRHQVQTSNKSEKSKLDQRSKGKGSNDQNEQGEANRRHDEGQTQVVKEPEKGNLLDIKV